MLFSLLKGVFLPRNNLENRHKAGLPLRKVPLRCYKDTTFSGRMQEMLKTESDLTEGIGTSPFRRLRSRLLC